MLEDGLPRCSTPIRRSMYQPRPNCSSATDNEGYSRFRCRLGRGSDIEAAVESLSRDLTAAYEENCPLRKVQGPHGRNRSSANQHRGHR
ncbi:unnamed protein product [Acanthoscelides obtectus]|uniref:Uncharacterized protein n=1 Tax=Acanthoscelides obtectus TaxID=200917 RepID=A0A9P0KU09_ACAOB|nr:unnamed protein product [Acanthoscelides obtectus]CAK1674607.1 hypothetical protein AOBTE_LOCUS29677 [Acanthoscelides obtectus]